MPKEYGEIKSSLQKAHPDWSEETVSSRASATFASIFGTNVQHAHELESQGKWEEYKKEHGHSGDEKKSADSEFMLSFGAEFKEAGKDHILEGFISSPELDLVGDVVECQKQIVDQINAGDAIASKLSYRHDWMKDKSKEYPPLGKATRAELRTNPKTGLKSAWASFILNQLYPNYKEEIYPQLKGGFLDGFSIEYFPVDYDYKTINNVRVRGLKSVRYLGTGLTGRPVQPTALMTGFYAKSFDYIEGKTEVDPMGEKDTSAADSVIMDLRKQLEAKDLGLAKTQAEMKELESKIADLLKVSEQKDAFAKELQAMKDEKRILMEAKEQEAKSAEGKLDAEFKEHQEKPSWDSATNIIQKLGGLKAFGI